MNVKSMCRAQTNLITFPRSKEYRPQWNSLASSLNGYVMVKNDVKRTRNNSKKQARGFETFIHKTMGEYVLFLYTVYLYGQELK